MQSFGPLFFAVRAIKQKGEVLRIGIVRHPAVKVNW